jgi:alpha-1,6-mannosyltransferase
VSTDTRRIAESRTSEPGREADGGVAARDPTAPIASGGLVVRYRYLVLATTVTVFGAIQTLNGQWSTDMWEHVAVVRRLIDDPFHTTPPLTLLDTPYTVTLGALGHILGVNAVTILSVAAIANLVLLIVGLRLFVVEATANRRGPFWALVFLLLLWGFSPYRFSGFFNLNSIGFVLPYPSTFATAIALLTLTAALRGLRERRPLLLIAVVAGTGSVVLVHPITGAWLVIGLLAVGISRARVRADWVWLGAAIAVGLALTLLWPYYSILDLLRDTSSYDAANKAMYDDVLIRLFPAVIGVLVIWRRFRTDRRDLLAVMLAGGLAIYAYGYVRDEYSYGRSLALVVLVLDVAAADGVGRLEAGFRWSRASGWLRAGVGALAALLVFGLVESRGGLVRMVPPFLLPTSVRASGELVRVDDRYGFLTERVGPNEVVIGATDRDNQVIPAIAGKPLQPFWMAPVVGDIEARKRAQTEFLDPATSSDRRAEIVARYKARYVLLHERGHNSASLVRALEASGATLVYRQDGFRLVALHDPKDPNH